jgi:magnesium chelatase family protein
MLVHAHSFAINRGIAEHVHVELDTRGGLPAFSVIGLGSGAARDARERVQAAVLNSGFGFPRKRVTVNLAPAATRKGGPELDLVLACCVLAAERQIDADRLARIGVFAELGLGGDLRPCESADAAAEAADRAGLAGLIVARGDLRQARGASRLPVAGLGSLREVAAFLAGELPRSPDRQRPAVVSRDTDDRGARRAVRTAGRGPSAASSAGSPRSPPAPSAGRT